MNEPQSPIFELPAEVVRVSLKKSTASFLISGGVVEPVGRLFRENDFALIGYDPRISGRAVDAEDFPEVPVVDEDEVWKGMVRELAVGGKILPKSLESLKELVEEVRGDAVSIVSDGAFAQKMRAASKAADGASKEAKRAERRNARKAERSAQNATTPGTEKKSPLSSVLEKRLSSCDISMKAYRYLREYENLSDNLPPKPTDDEVSTLLANLEKITLSLAFSGGTKALPMMKLMTVLRSLAIVVFPGAHDSLRPIVDAAIKKHSKPQPQAENRS